MSPWTLLRRPYVRPHMTLNEYNTLKVFFRSPLTKFHMTGLDIHKDIVSLYIILKGACFFWQGQVPSL